jgi:hypothetical protein
LQGKAAPTDLELRTPIVARVVEKTPYRTGQRGPVGREPLQERLPFLQLGPKQVDSLSVGNENPASRIHPDHTGCDRGEHCSRPSPRLFQGALAGANVRGHALECTKYRLKLEWWAPCSYRHCLTFPQRQRRAPKLRYGSGKRSRCHLGSSQRCRDATECREQEHERQIELTRCERRVVCQLRHGEHCQISRTARLDYAIADSFGQLGEQPFPGDLEPPVEGQGSEGARIHQLAYDAEILEHGSAGSDESASAI